MKAPEHQILSSCEGKARFDTWAEAVHSTHPKTHRAKRYQPYKCRICNGYHVGNPPKIKTRSRQRMIEELEL